MVYAKTEDSAGIGVIVISFKILTSCQNFDNSAPHLDCLSSACRLLPRTGDRGPALLSYVGAYGVRP
jgi:hypothetical protein